MWLVRTCSGIAWITRFDPAGYECHAAGQLPADMINIRKLVPKSYRKATKVMCPDIVAHDALNDGNDLLVIK